MRSRDSREIAHYWTYPMRGREMVCVPPFCWNARIPPVGGRVFFIQHRFSQNCVMTAFQHDLRDFTPKNRLK